jgi:hypothetical protein
MHDGETEIVVADDGLRRTSKRELPAAKGICKEVVHRVAATPDPSWPEATQDDFQ